MLRSVEFEAELPPEARINSQMGSIFHGLLMEQLDSKTAEILHEDGLRPYSQGVFLRPEDKKAVWRIGTLNDTAFERIVEPLLAINRPLLLKQKGYTVNLKNPMLIRECSYEDLMDDVFQYTAAPIGAELKFITTTSFKRNGRYVIMPELYLIYKSLLQRWNNFSPKVVLEENELDDVLAKNSKIHRYNMRSQAFSVDGRNIYGFGGRLQLSFTGNDMSARIALLLLKLANFSGIGIKSALGMGMTEITALYREDD